ncbi:hypothetical protein E2C01_069634 [Portunus trituberculatus]|uniref:Uncharacterized protein n=1 Tax=Portunus trituberculatus TaxID=210409 RepID=A0A5B7HS29_PORTR|nr:hypothetical protein [Portunus trituberculatus]
MVNKWYRSLRAAGVLRVAEGREARRLRRGRRDMDILKLMCRSADNSGFGSDSLSISESFLLKLRNVRFGFLHEELKYRI